MRPRSDHKKKSIGNYVLEKTIGAGTFGKVKLGTHVLTGEQVAIKILEKNRIIDANDIERVSREIHILKLLRHPHVIQLYEIVETRNQLYLIMEYASGGELFDLIVHRKRLEEPDACRYFHQIVAGVELMHSKGVAHRDLKPENLLLDESDNIKIADYGLSNTFQPGSLLKTACGSPCYAAPEMLSGKRYDPKYSDAWAMGVVLFSMVCGYLPFEGKNTGELYKLITRGKFHLPDYLSEPLKALVKGLLTIDPKARYTMSAIKQSEWFQTIIEPDFPVTSTGCGVVSCSPCANQQDEPLGFDERVLGELSHSNHPLDYVIKCLKLNKHNHATTTYYLLLKRLRGQRPLPARQSPKKDCPVYSMATPLVMPAQSNIPAVQRNTVRLPPFSSRLPIRPITASIGRTHGSNHLAGLPASFTSYGHVSAKVESFRRPFAIHAESAKRDSGQAMKIPKLSSRNSTFGLASVRVPDQIGRALTARPRPESPSARTRTPSPNISISLSGDLSRSRPPSSRPSSSYLAARYTTPAPFSFDRPTRSSASKARSRSGTESPVFPYVKPTRTNYDPGVALPRPLTSRPVYGEPNILSMSRKRPDQRPGPYGRLSPYLMEGLRTRPALPLQSRPATTGGSFRPMCSAR